MIKFFKNIAKTLSELWLLSRYKLSDSQEHLNKLEQEDIKATTLGNEPDIIQELGIETVEFAKACQFLSAEWNNILLHQGQCISNNERKRRGIPLVRKQAIRKNLNNRGGKNYEFKRY